MKQLITRRKQRARRRRAFVALSVIALLFLQTCKDKGNPVNGQGSPQGKVVFAMIDSTIGPGGIYTMNLDGTNLRAVAKPGDTVRFPQGPTGDIYILNEYWPLFYPRWSPDGKKIVSELMWAFEGYVIMLMNADGTNKHVLSKVRSAALQPQWSPEGDKFLFMRSGYLGAVFATGIVDTSGDNDRDFRIAASAIPYLFEGDSVWFSGNYRWGPRGDIIYGIGSVNRKPPGEYIVGSNLQNEIFAFDTQTGEVLERLTRNDRDEYGFQVSPQGDRIAFDRGITQKARFYVLSLSTGSTDSILLNAPISFSWNWCSEGKRIVFSMDENPNPWRESLYLYVLEINNPASLKKITHFNAREPDLYIPKQ